MRIEPAIRLRQLEQDTQLSIDEVHQAVPQENGYIESFNEKLRDELLDRETFTTLVEASILIEE